MKKVILALATMLLAASCFGQTLKSINAASYGGYTLVTLNAVLSGSGTATFSPFQCSIIATDGRNESAIATTVPLTFNDGSNTETLTPSAITLTPYSCSVTVTFGHAHAAGIQVTSGTAGLQEAINSIGSGTVEVASDFTGTLSTLAAAATGSGSIYIIDRRVAPWIVYLYNGTNFVPANGSGPSGSSWVPFVNTELVTLSTIATTTDTAGNLLPALSVIDLVQGVVNTTITAACTGWELGDGSTAARFTANDTTLTAGEAKQGNTAASMFQAAAAKVRITCAGGNAGAGKVRVVVYGRTFVLPAS